MNKTVGDVLKAKGSTVWSVGLDESIYEALKLMAEKNIGAVLVLEGGRIRGIFSERDYARKVVLQGRSSRQTTVREAMTSRVAVVSPAQTIEECMALMTDKKFRHLPVMDNNQVVGLISIGDVVGVKISEQDFIIEQLERYITGTRA